MALRINKKINIKLENQICLDILQGNTLEKSIQLYLANVNSCL